MDNLVIGSFHGFLVMWQPLADWGVAVGTGLLALVTWLLARGAKGQVKEAQQSSDRATVMTVLREYSSPRLRDARKAVYALPPMIPESEGWDGLSGPEVASVEEVSNYLDSLGFLINRGLLEASAFAAFMGGSVTNMWRVLGPYVYDYRIRHNSPTYQRHFEYLAALMQDTKVDKELEVLATLPP